MIESTRQTHYWYLPTVSIIKPISKLLGKALKELAYLCRPEDTTDTVGHPQSNITYSKAIEARPLLKGVFWVIVSIAVSVTAGQML